MGVFEHFDAATGYLAVHAVGIVRISTTHSRRRSPIEGHRIDDQRLARDEFDLQARPNVDRREPPRPATGRKSSCISPSKLRRQFLLHGATIRFVLRGEPRPP